MRTRSNPLHPKDLRNLPDMVRQHNWLPEEIRLMIEGLIARRQTIYGRNSPYLTEARKNQAWDDIADIINAANLRRLSKVRRTREQLKAKERYYTSELRTKYRRICDLREQTGLGAAVFDNPRNILTQNEQLALTLIGETSATGVRDAVRVHHPNLVPNPQAVAPLPPANVAAAAGAPPTPPPPPPPAAVNNAPAAVAAPPVVDIQVHQIAQPAVADVPDPVAPAPLQMVGLPIRAQQPVNNAMVQVAPAPPATVNNVAAQIPANPPSNNVRAPVAVGAVNLGPLPFPRAQPIYNVPAVVAPAPVNNHAGVLPPTPPIQNVFAAATSGANNHGFVATGSSPRESVARSVSFAHSVVNASANGLAAAHGNPVAGPSMTDMSSNMPAVNAILPEILLEPPVVFIPEGPNDVDEKDVIVKQEEYVSSCHDTAPAAKIKPNTSSLSVGLGSQSSGTSIIPPTQVVGAAADIFDQSHISISSESTCSSIRDLFVKPVKGKGNGKTTKRKMSTSTSFSAQPTSTSTSGLPSPPAGVKRSRLSLPKPIPMTDTRRDDLLQVQANLYAGLRSLTEQITQLVNLVRVIAEYFSQQTAHLQRENHRRNNNGDDMEDDDIHNAPTE